MAEQGFSGTLALHPSHSAEQSTFVPSERISINSYPHDYRDLFCRGSVLVTDYSSVAFDFAYLRKPVVYAQGDREEFFEGHLYSEGYYSYHQHGFGPVVRTVPELVDSLVHLMASSGEMGAVYRDRVDRFFAFSGGGNCERLSRAIEHSLTRDPG
jgi:CDP-glycerol glycerophosphotransferase (TagB/SpsB family)